MIDITKKENIRIGMIGRIKEFPNQKESEYTEGKIVAIMTQEQFEPNGIRVSLDNGAIGNLVKILDSNDSPEQIKKRLRKRENQIIERKSSFAFDIKESKKNDDLQMAVAVAVASFINTDGGFVYVGVNDEGNCLGLTDDYRLMKLRQNSDGLEDKMKQYFNKVLSDPIIQQQCITFSFPIIDNKEICEIYVKPSYKPIFLNPRKFVVLVGAKRQQRWFDDFYIRRGNSHYLIEKNSEFFH